MNAGSISHAQEWIGWLEFFVVLMQHKMKSNIHIPILTMNYSYGSSLSVRIVSARNLQISRKQISPSKPHYHSCILNSLTHCFMLFFLSSSLLCIPYWTSLHWWLAICIERYKSFNEMMVFFLNSSLVAQWKNFFFLLFFTMLNTTRWKEITISDHPNADEYDAWLGKKRKAKMTRLCIQMNK